MLSGPGKYLKGRAWVGLVNEESRFVLSQGLWKSLCGPHRSPLLQFPSPKLMHLVLSPGIEPVPQSGFIGPALTLCTSGLQEAGRWHLPPQPPESRLSPTELPVLGDAMWVFSLLCLFSGRTAQSLILSNVLRRGSASTPRHLPTARNIPQKSPYS